MTTRSDERDRTPISVRYGRSPNDRRDRRGPAYCNAHRRTRARKEHRRLCRASHSKYHRSHHPSLGKLSSVVQQGFEIAEEYNSIQSLQRSCRKLPMMMTVYHRLQQTRHQRSLSCHVVLETSFGFVAQDDTSTKHVECAMRTSRSMLTKATRSCLSDQSTGTLSEPRSQTQH